MEREPLDTSEQLTSQPCFVLAPVAGMAYLLFIAVLSRLGEVHAPTVPDWALMHLNGAIALSGAVCVCFRIRHERKPRSLAPGSWLAVAVAAPPFFMVVGFAALRVFGERLYGPLWAASHVVPTALCAAGAACLRENNWRLCLGAGGIHFVVPLLQYLQYALEAFCPAARRFTIGYFGWSIIAVAASGFALSVLAVCLIRDGTRRVEYDRVHFLGTAVYTVNICRSLFSSMYAAWTYR